MDDYQRTMDVHLALWKARLEVMKAHPKRWVAIQHKKQFEDWRASCAAAFAELAERKAAGGDRWPAIEVQLRKAWLALESAVEPQMHAY